MPFFVFLNNDLASSGNELVISQDENQSPSVCFNDANELLMQLYNMWGLVVVILLTDQP